MMYNATDGVNVVDDLLTRVGEIPSVFNEVCLLARTTCIVLINFDNAFASRKACIASSVWSMTAPKKGCITSAPDMRYSEHRA